MQPVIPLSEEVSNLEIETVRILTTVNYATGEGLLSIDIEPILRHW